MKAFALALLCIVAGVQARSTGSNDAKSSVAESGAAPWLVHLRLAVNNGNGLLETCAASLIDQRWLLTSASCVQRATYIWSRYGTVDVIRPELVLETGSVAVNVNVHPSYDASSGANDIALVSLNRDVQLSSNIAIPVLVSEGAEIPSSGSFCAFGENKSNGPGEQLRCINVELNAGEDGAIVASSDDGAASNFDIGAPLVVDGVQYGILVDAASGTFLNPAAYREWIEETAGITLSSGSSESDEESSSSSDEEEEEVDAVRIAN